MARQNHEKESTGVGFHYFAFIILSCHDSVNFHSKGPATPWSAAGSGSATPLWGALAHAKTVGRRGMLVLNPLVTSLRSIVLNPYFK
jgi:hypothetical protein